VVALGPRAAREAGLPPLDRARLHLAQASAVAALYGLLLKAGGRDAAADGGASREGERLAAYTRKVKRAAGAIERPSVTLDIAAASRFIDHAIPDLSAEQREALRSAGQAAKRARPDGRAAGGGGGVKRPATSAARPAAEAAEAALREALGGGGGGE
jgi:exosome complex protein LRP1